MASMNFKRGNRLFCVGRNRIDHQRSQKNIPRGFLIRMARMFFHLSTVDFDFSHSS
jgi:hypothetical protein